MNHDLKISPTNFRQVQSGRPFDTRVGDRPFQPGDTVTYREYRTHAEGSMGGEYTGLTIERRIDLVYQDLPGLQVGYVAFTIAPLQGRN